MHRSIRLALCTLALSVAAASIAPASQAASPQAPTAKVETPQKPIQPGVKRPGTPQPNSHGNAADRAADAWYKACVLSGGGISTTENGGNTCTAPDGTKIF